MMRSTAVFFLRFYQILVSPFFGANCRYHPSCSEYSVQAIEKFGLLKGVILGGRRLLRCHPWHPGGLDPLPDHFRHK